MNIDKAYLKKCCSCNTASHLTKCPDCGKTVCETCMRFHKTVCEG